VQFGLKQLLVRQAGLILGDQGGRKGTAQGVFHHLAVLAGAEQDADRRTLVRLPDITVEGFQVEPQLAEVLRFEFTELQLDGDETRKTAVEKE
jgi:hypothetical protein